jgi:hypothetical protein
VRTHACGGDGGGGQLSYSDPGTGQHLQYRGEVKREGSTVPHGRGVQIFPDGAVYSGEFRHGVFEGEGTWTQPNGYRYQGCWERGKRHGRWVRAPLPAWFRAAPCAADRRPAVLARAGRGGRGCRSSSPSTEVSSRGPTATTCVPPGSPAVAAVPCC